MGGTESQGISRVGQAVLCRLMDSHIWHLPAGSMAFWTEGSEKVQRPLLTFLSERQLSTSSHLDARHFNFSLYVIGAFQAATPVLELRGNECE